MSGKLHFELRTADSPTEAIDIDDYNENMSIRELKELVSEAGRCLPNNIELIFRGNTLNDNSTVKSVGIRPGFTIFVLKKIIKAAPKKLASEIDVEKLISAFRMSVRLPDYKASFRRISKPSILQNIIATTPELQDDPVAMAIIKDPELLVHMSEPATVRRIVERHPALAEAAMNIASLIHEHASSRSSSRSSQQPSYFYPMDALSEEEDMESSQNSDLQPRTAESSFNSSITSMQLAAALSAAQSLSASSSTNPVAGASSSYITPEMLGQALGQAFATSSPSTTVPAAPNVPASQNLSDMEVTSRRLAQHLLQMHEMGLRDDILNLQALEATDWNVQEAINLVFSGGMTDNDVDFN